ncbi:MAG: smtA [Actinomycetia bacterium]|nr:smtA [Actinomycetes bacterium]
MGRLSAVECQNAGVPIHEIAAAGFDAQAEAYERARPSYPPDAVAWIVDGLRIGPGRTVLDLAAGTGKLTRLLTPTGARVVAAEPVDGMLRALRTAVPGVDALASTAEALALRDATVDGVTVAQAFHWFEPEAALAEMHRVLRPEGRVALVWNGRDLSVRWIATIWGIFDREEATAPWRKNRDRAWLDEPFTDSPWFGPLHKKTFRHVQRMKPAEVVDRVASVSHIAALPPEEHQRVRDEIAALLAEHPETRGRDTLEFPYLVDAYWSERR